MDCPIRPHITHSDNANIIGIDHLKIFQLLMLHFDKINFIDIVKSEYNYNVKVLTK